MNSFTNNTLPLLPLQWNPAKWAACGRARVIKPRSRSARTASRWSWTRCCPEDLARQGSWSAGRYPSPAAVVSGSSSCSSAGVEDPRTGGPAAKKTSHCRLLRSRRRLRSTGTVMASASQKVGSPPHSRRDATPAACWNARFRPAPGSVLLPPWSQGGHRAHRAHAWRVPR